MWRHMIPPVVHIGDHWTDNYNGYSDVDMRRKVEHPEAEPFIFIIINLCYNRYKQRLVFAELCPIRKVFGGSVESVTYDVYRKNWVWSRIELANRNWTQPKQIAYRTAIRRELRPEILPNMTMIKNELRPGSNCHQKWTILTKILLAFYKLLHYAVAGCIIDKGPSYGVATPCYRLYIEFYRSLLHEYASRNHMLFYSVIILFFQPVFMFFCLRS